LTDLIADDLGGQSHRPTRDAPGEDVAGNVTGKPKGTPKPAPFFFEFGGLLLLPWLTGLGLGGVGWVTCAGKGGGNTESGVNDTEGC
jgi:hypothetical protein